MTIERILQQCKADIDAVIPARDQPRGAALPLIRRGVPNYAGSLIRVGGGS